MGTKKDGDSCYEHAMDDEPMFVLLARDPFAPTLVMAWATKREQDINAGYRPEEDRVRVNEAVLQAAKMEQWRKENDGTWRKIS